MARTRRKAAIPSFALYGETPAAPVDLLHVEAIQSRSRLYQWEIGVHTHRSLHQILWIESGPAIIALDEARVRCEVPFAVIVPPLSVVTVAAPVVVVAPPVTDDELSEPAETVPPEIVAVRRAVTLTVPTTDIGQRSRAHKASKRASWSGPSART